MLTVMPPEVGWMPKHRFALYSRLKADDVDDDDDDGLCDSF